MVIEKSATAGVLKARVECAIFRCRDASAKNIPWRGMIR